MLKKIIIYAFLFIMLPSLLFAAPAITGVSGTVSNGESITISGSGFGTGPTVVLFDDFELGTNGNSIGATAQVGTWNDVVGTNIPKYSNTNKISGSLSVRMDMSADYLEYIEASLGSVTKLFVSWWLFLPATDNYPGDPISSRNWKQLWIQGSSTVDDDLVVPTFLPDDTYEINGNDGLYDEYVGMSFSKGSWKRLWTYIYGGSSSNGIVKLYELTGSGVNALVEDSNVTVLKSGGAFEKVRVNGYARQTATCHPTFDDIYIATGDHAQARVEIGNAATYAASTNLTMVTPTSWGATSIVGVVRQGSFSDGGAYLYVTDDAGSVNSSGYAVTIGSESTPPITSIVGVSIVGGRVQ
jgi:hypothetical protein